MKSLEFQWSNIYCGFFPCWIWTFYNLINNGRWDLIHKKLDLNTKTRTIGKDLLCEIWGWAESENYLRFRIEW
jgi:hypothetical protein